MSIAYKRVLFQLHHSMALASLTGPRDSQPLLQWLQRSLACRLAGLVIGASALYASTAAWADQVVVDEISALMEQGRLEQAAKRADAYAKTNPGDIQVRFLQGVIATEQGSNAKAIDIFTAISREYPQLPEPFNNLAVLYAAQGDERKAVEVLESAIRTNPSYATAHENLGDLYARMASEAYTKALQLDDSRKALQPKLSLITQIVPVQEGASAQPRSDAVSVAQATPQAPAPTAAQVRQAQAQAREAEQAEQQRAAQQKQAQEQARQARLEAEQAAQRQLAERAAADKAAAEKAAADKIAADKAAADKAAAERAAAAKAVADKAEADKLLVQQRLEEAKKAAAQPAPAPIPSLAQAPVAQADKPAQAPAQAAAKPAERPVSNTASATAEIEGVVKAWTKAWEAQDMPGYFALYSNSFKPADGSSLAAWKQQRTERTVGRPTINVQLRNLRVTGVTNDAATVRFHQTYSSGGFKATTQKTLSMKKEGGHWRIVNERTGG